MPPEGQAPTVPAGQTPQPDAQTTEQTQPDAGAKPSGAAGRIEDLPEWAQREIRETRQEAAKYRRERAEADRAAKAADETRLAESAEWKTLAEKRQARIAELEPQAEAAAKLSEIVAKQLDAETATWPESVRAIMPAADVPLLQRLEWAERTRPLAQELLSAKGTPPIGTRFPQQHAGSGGQQPQTTKAVAESYVAKTYARPKPG